MAKRGGPRPQARKNYHASIKRMMRRRKETEHFIVKKKKEGVWTEG